MSITAAGPWFATRRTLARVAQDKHRHPLVLLRCRCPRVRQFRNGWDETSVGVYPIQETDDPQTQAYLSALSTRDLADVEVFLNDEAKEYGITVFRPVSVELLPAVEERPPERAPDSGLLGNMWWSLKMRIYARRAALSTGRELPQIRIFVLYHNPDVTPQVPHSVGLQKGLVGVVHAFADRSLGGGNNVVIAHELLHTLARPTNTTSAASRRCIPSGTPNHSGTHVFRRNWRK